MVVRRRDAVVDLGRRHFLKEAILSVGRSGLRGESSSSSPSVAEKPGQILQAFDRGTESNGERRLR
jgi:hypothetical protein